MKKVEILVPFKLQNNLFVNNKQGFPAHSLPFHGLSSFCNRANIAPRNSDVMNVSQDSRNTTDKS
jgi:hypothetical protein